MVLMRLRVFYRIGRLGTRPSGYSLRDRSVRRLTIVTCIWKILFMRREPRVR